MMDWIIKELQWKTNTFGETGQVVAFDAGVVKSDTQIPAELQQALRDALHHLEDVAEEHKDYHPGSEKKVLDLVHPSLFPLVYGRTRVLPDEIITPDNCLGSVGQGRLLPLPMSSYKGGKKSWDYHLVFNPYSCKFQWLPCDIEFTEDNGCRIISYINNLHPKENRKLYGVIEKILARVIPLWDTALTNVQVGYTRIQYTKVEYFHHPDPKPEYPNTKDDRSIDDYDEQYEQWERSRPIRLPEPDEFQPSEAHRKVNLRQDFAESGLQVIVKLANIELTPESPEYGGGSWHVEGQLVSFEVPTPRNQLTRYRTNVSVQRPYTTMTAKISPRILLPSANGHRPEGSARLTTPRTVMNSYTRSLALNQVKVTLKLPNILVAFRLGKVVCLPSPTSFSIASLHSH